MFSTEELKQLLAEADDPAWRVEISDDEEYWEIRHADYMKKHRAPIATDMTQGNAELMARAPELAAEVIRLREENTYLSRIEYVAKQAADDGCVTLAIDLEELEMEYAGDQT